MSDITSALAVSASGMAAQSDRLRLVSENIANADTPGYRRKTAAFAPEIEGGRPTGGVAMGPVRLDRAELPQIFDPGHPMADDDGRYQGSNVELLIEIADAREAQRSYEANLRMFDQTRQMSQGLIELLRR